MLLFDLFFFERNNSKSKGAPPPPPAQTQMTQVKMNGSAAMALLIFVNTDKNYFIQIMTSGFVFLLFGIIQKCLYSCTIVCMKNIDFDRSILAGLKHNQLY